MTSLRVPTGALLPVSAFIAVVGAGGCGGDSDKSAATIRARLTLERAVSPTTRQPELVVSLPNERLNTLATTRGETSVLLRCVDQSGEVTIRQRHEWPLPEEVGFPPHLHQPARKRVLDSVRACRLTGQGIDFVGRVPGRLPAAQ